MIYGIDSSFLVAVELTEHPQHASCRGILTVCTSRGDQFALAPQVLAEFIPVATDPRRFTNPLGMDRASEIAKKWWTAHEVKHATPSSESIVIFFEWMQKHRLGRKRILDTLLAATYFRSGVTRLLTLNARDFAIFDCFACE